MSTQNIKQAVQILHAGGLVAFPTETVYGLGADASNEVALRKIFAAKERPLNNPLIVHVAKVEQLANWAREIPADVDKLAHAFWPGSLTIILKKQPFVSDILTGGQDTIGIRIPSHPLALSLLQEFTGGIAAPSANKFTHISPTTATAVREELGDKVDLILDGGECAVGLESTILDMSGETPTILRPGMITSTQIANVLGIPIANKQKNSAIRTPGMHYLHYAPITKTCLVQNGNLPQDVKGKCVYLTTSHSSLQNVKIVTMPHDASTYAHDLYRILRDLDQQHFDCIFIEEVPDTVEWEAIRDRLSKAASK